MRKKIIKAIAALVCVCCVSMGWAQTLGADYSLFGVPLGSEKWHEATGFNAKGEIFWDADEYPGLGWNLSGIDLSKYSGVRVEANSGKTDVYIKIYDVETNSEWDFIFDKKGVAIINFNGVGSGWHDGSADELDASKGCKIVFVRRGGTQTKNDKTVIKKVELIEATGEDYSYLNVLGIRFGSDCQNATINGNEVTWKKGEQDFHAGWNLIGVDLSEYARVRVELEKDEMGDLEIGLWDKDWKLHSFKKIGPNLFEANLSGEGAAGKNDDAPPLNPSEGMRIAIRKWQNKKLSSDKKTVVKSVTLIKEANAKLKELEFLGVSFGSECWKSYLSDEAEICWEKSKDGGLLGWNLNGVDLTPYKDKKVRIEIESTDVPLWLEYQGENYYASFSRVAPNVFEEYLTGKNARWLSGSDIENYDLSKGFTIKLRSFGPVKGTEKTVIKSISFVDADETPVQNLSLAGINLGSYRNSGDGNCYVENNSKIIWSEKTWNNCGWDLTGIDLTETPVVSIELESTDVPVMIQIRHANNDEGNKYKYDFKCASSRSIQIDLSKREAWDPVKKTTIMRNSSSTKTGFDLSKGVVIYIVPETNPSKPGKTTVLKRAELLEGYTK